MDGCSEEVEMLLALLCIFLLLLDVEVDDGKTNDDEA